MPTAMPSLPMADALSDSERESSELITSKKMQIVKVYVYVSIERALLIYLSVTNINFFTTSVNGHVLSMIFQGRLGQVGTCSQRRVPSIR